MTQVQRTRKRKPLVRLARSIGFIVLAVVLIWWIGGYFLQRWIIYPRFAIPSRAIALPDDAESFTIKTDAGTTQAAYLPPLTSDAGPPGVPGAPGPHPLVVFAHGNADLIGFFGQALEPYRKLGFAVLLVEFRGYGRSSGKPSEKAITADFLAGLDHTIKHHNIDTSRLIYHGYSLGAGVVCAMARTRPPAAFILQSPFTSITAMAWRMGFPSFLVRDPYDNAGYLPTCELPVLIMHGRGDEVIPFAMGKQLAADCPHARFIALDSGHNNVPINSPAYWQHITDFLAQSH